MEMKVEISQMMKCLGRWLLNRTVTIDSHVKRGKDNYSVKRSVSCSLEPILNAVFRVILAIGLIFVLMDLAKCTRTIALIQL